MRKNLLRTLSLVISVILISTMAFAGCGNSTEPGSGSQSQSSQQTKKFKIGFTNFLSGIYSLDILEKNAKYATEAYGNEFIAVNDGGKTEKVVQDVQNLISSGVDGIVFFGLVDTLFPVVSQMCEKAKVPFVCYDHLPSDNTLATLRKNPYFVGVVGEKDYDAGYPIGEYAAKEGLKKAIIITGQVGDTTHEARTKGFTEAFEKAGGKVVGVAHCSSTNFIEEGRQKAEDLLTANPDVDCVYGSNGDLALGAMQGLKKHTDVKAKLYATDLDPKILEGLTNGEIAAANGAHWINASYSVALLQNYLTNHQLKDKDGQAPLITVPIIVLPANQTDLYKKFWIDDQPYTQEELKNLVNGSITTNQFQEILNNYSIEERLLQRAKEGKITDDELKAVGISK